ncbi:MAG TPA: glycoside hydrolase family 88 protein [Bacillota bacterium]|nr:glycoside hydrolase family 88 protein [Bacillota bacterium]
MEQVKDEGIRQIERYRLRPIVNQRFCKSAIDFVLSKIDENLDTFRNKFPAPASQNNIYPAVENVEWTSSFWTGMLWLAFEVTGNTKYREVAEGQLESYQRRVTEKIATDTHDLGFLYTLSCVAAYKLTGAQIAKATALQAADLLITRYFEKAGIIQAWGDLNDPEQQGRMIIDCCMNLPLLYWAAQITGNNRYYKIAYQHARQAASYLVREDGSTFHTFYMDVDTGQPRFGKTCQGYADDSCWARGQAWGIYGFALSYLYTGNSGFLNIGKKITHYFLNRLPEDQICYWDLGFTEGYEDRDSSAAAIAACGLLEFSKRLPLSDELKQIYENAALLIIRSLAENYTTLGLEKSNGILDHAVYNKPKREGVDECNIWGDYFYFEALVRLLKDWESYW